jgi:hypothetical protein
VHHITTSPISELRVIKLRSNQLSGYFCEISGTWVGNSAGVEALLSAAHTNRDIALVDLSGNYIGEATPFMEGALKNRSEGGCGVSIEPLDTSFRARALEITSLVAEARVESEST